MPVTHKWRQPNNKLLQHDEIAHIDIQVHAEVVSATQEALLETVEVTRDNQLVLVLAETGAIGRDYN